MSLPKYSELYLPFLTTIQDGAVYSVKEVRDRLASSLHLSEDDLSQLISSNRQSVWASRFGWANTYLKKAGLVIAPKAGDGFVTKATGDGGVDGIIYEDKLGFNLIYIQAKRWDKDSVIGKPEIQKFTGAMMGPPKVEKGLFITTAKFSQGAMDFAKAQHIILVDGEKLTELMIEYNLGVSAQKTYQIKRIDSDYFSNDSQ